VVVAVDSVQPPPVAAVDWVQPSAAAVDWVQPSPVAAVDWVQPSPPPAMDLDFRSQVLRTLLPVERFST
jgi:hypothetical protein